MSAIFEGTAYPPHVAEPAALGVYALGILGAALAAYGAGRLRRIRRRYP